MNKEPYEPRETSTKDEQAMTNQDVVLEAEEMIEEEAFHEFVEVELRNWRTAYFTKPKNLMLVPDQMVIIQVDRGMDIGTVIQVAIKGEEYQEMYKDKKIMSIIRVATDSDLEMVDEIEKKEQTASDKFLELVVKYPFEMKLIDTKYQFDGNKLTFFFTAECRIDFREFVRELAQIFRTRIELHQSTGRDEAKRLGGYGMCGNKYCCTTFLKRFNQVTIKMAKDQNLSGNLAKISGPCGRLLCCLHFEGDFYAELAKEYPEIGDEVIVKKNKMYVFRNDYQSKMVYLSGEDQLVESIHIDEFNKLFRKNTKR